MKRLKFKVSGLNETIFVNDYDLFIAGFTGSNRENVEKHLQELRDQGIEVPEKVPSFYRVPPELASQDNIIKVRGRMTSGEIEPVLLISEGSYYITLGSDHTDRDIERRSIAESKASCPKPIADVAFPLEDAVKEWEKISLKSETFRSGAWKQYQKGKVTDLIQPLKLAAMLQEENGGIPRNLVMFLGTVPIEGGKFIFSEGFRGSMFHVNSNFSLNLEYRIEVEDK